MTIESIIAMGIAGFFGCMIGSFLGQFLWLWLERRRRS